MNQPPPQYPPGPGQPYPVYPPRPPKKSNTGTWILLILLGLVLLLCGSCAVTMLGAYDDRDSTSRTTAAAAPPPATVRATTARPTTTRSGFTDDEINALAFTAALDSKGIRYSSRDNAVGLAHSICDGKEAGLGTAAIAVTIADKGGYSLTDAGYIVGAAHATYCP
ncbi:DUF732 domain-containing protein [Nocardia salmonicida]|uniref:DUF732 domain-containing protein n=1 Tax=Nocardia salmonicida TaxID=53431 RepID=UPI0033CC1017